MKAKTLKRVLEEVKAVNADFFNLRTVISEDAVENDLTNFYFVMLPNDGAMAHLSLVGAVGIPEVSDWCQVAYEMSRVQHTDTDPVRFSDLPRRPSHCQIIHPHETIQRRRLQTRAPRRPAKFYVLRHPALGERWGELEARVYFVLAVCFAHVRDCIV